MPSNNSIPFDPEQFRGVLDSPEGRQLMRLLNQDGGKLLRQAAGALQSGNTQAACDILAPIMENREAQRLTSELGARAERSSNGRT